MELIAELGTLHVRMLHVVVHVSQVALDFVHLNLYTLVLFYELYQLSAIVLLTLVRILQRAHRLVALVVLFEADQPKWIISVPRLREGVQLIGN